MVNKRVLQNTTKRIYNLLTVEAIVNSQGILNFNNRQICYDKAALTVLH